VRLTDIDGVTYDSTSSEERLILGDTSGGTFGNAFDVTIDCINIDYTGVWIPVGTDADADGMSDLWENSHFGDLTSGVAGDDDDGDDKTNAEEYQADTDPNNATSRLRIQSIIEASPDNFDITVPDTSTSRQYTLHESGDLGITDSWEAVSGQGPVIGTGGSLVFTPTSSTRNFYRVEVSVP
jgi:hypothetical protein